MAWQLPKWDRVFFVPLHKIILILKNETKKTQSQ
mgnify:CR=1 FL=1